MYAAIVGTSVRDRKYDAAIAKITASASGRNSAAAGPESAKIGRNTIQIDSVDTNAGMAICSAPVDDRFAQRRAVLDVAMNVLDRHRGVVDENTHGQRQAAERHHVQRLTHRPTDR